MLASYMDRKFPQFTQSCVDSCIACIESSLSEIQKSESKLCDLLIKFETQLHDHYKSMGNMLTDHALGLDTKVAKCCKTLASNSCSASSSVTANVVQELEDIGTPQEKCVVSQHSWATCIKFWGWS